MHLRYLNLVSWTFVPPKYITGARGEAKFESRPTRQHRSMSGRRHLQTTPTPSRSWCGFLGQVPRSQSLFHIRSRAGNRRVCSIKTTSSLTSQMPLNNASDIAKAGHGDRCNGGIGVAVGTLAKQAPHLHGPAYSRPLGFSFEGLVYGRISGFAAIR